MTFMPLHLHVYLRFIQMKWEKKKLIYSLNVASMDTKVAMKAVSDAKKLFSHYSTLMSWWVAFKQMCLINMKNKDGVGDMISGMLYKMGIISHHAINFL